MKTPGELFTGSHLLFLDQFFQLFTDFGDQLLQDLDPFFRILHQFGVGAVQECSDLIGAVAADAGNGAGAAQQLKQGGAAIGQIQDLIHGDLAFIVHDVQLLQGIAVQQHIDELVVRQRVAFLFLYELQQILGVDAVAGAVDADGLGVGEVEVALCAAVGLIHQSDTVAVGEAVGSCAGPVFQDVAVEVADDGADGLPLHDGEALVRGPVGDLDMVDVIGHQVQIAVFDDDGIAAAKRQHQRDQQDCQDPLHIHPSK